MSISVVTLNVNGLRDVNKRIGFLHLLSRLCSDLDVVCLQEVHVLSLEECSSWSSSFGFRVAFLPDTNHSRGTAILFKSSLVLKNSLCDDDGRFVACDFSFHDKSFRVVSIYAPNVRPDRDVFFAYVLSQVDPSVQTVFCVVILIPPSIVLWIVVVPPLWIIAGSVLLC